MTSMSKGKCSAEEGACCRSGDSSVHLREISNVSHTEKEGGWKGLPEQLETHGGERRRHQRAFERRSAGGSNSHSIMLREDAQFVTELRNGKLRLVGRGAGSTQAEWSFCPHDAGCSGAG